VLFGIAGAYTIAIRKNGTVLWSASMSGITEYHRTDFDYDLASGDYLDFQLASSDQVGVDMAVYIRLERPTEF